ncbi:MAG TPA: PilZ domain-containing protein [Blastocatellia bacterium]|nr:PilZ domain-containing protein [Blastocatellia bacterium]
MGKRARRFNLSWPVQIKVTGSGQIEFEEEGCLQNISSSGALLSLNAPIEIGAKAKLFIKLPSKDDKWMRYYGEVVRSETVSQKVSVAVKFSSARPAFCRTKD